MDSVHSINRSAAYPSQKKKWFAFLSIWATKAMFSFSNDEIKSLYILNSIH